MTDADYEELAKQIERELYGICGSATSDDYKSKCRSLLFNLKDAHNPLKHRVFSGEVPPDRLCKMSPEELASPELAMKRKAIEMQAIESVVIKTEEDIIPESLRMTTSAPEEANNNSGSPSSSRKEMDGLSDDRDKSSSLRASSNSTTAGDSPNKKRKKKILQRDPHMSSMNVDHEDNEDNDNNEDDVAQYPIDMDDVVMSELPTMAMSETPRRKSISPPPGDDSDKDNGNEYLNNDWLNGVDGPPSNTPPGTPPLSSDVASEVDINDSDSTTTVPATTVKSPNKPGLSSSTGTLASAFIPSRSIGTDKGPIIWRGLMEKNFGIAEFRLKGYHLSGINIATLSAPEYSFPPPETFNVLGRMDVHALSSYLRKLSFSTSVLRSVMLLEPDNIEGDPAENLSRYLAAFEYYYSRKRAAVINTFSNPFVKEMFVVPVKGSHRLPEWIEDYPESSIENKKDKLVCVFVLNKREMLFQNDDAADEAAGDISSNSDNTNNNHINTNTNYSDGNLSGVSANLPETNPFSNPTRPLSMLPLQPAIASPVGVNSNNSDAYDPLFEDAMQSPPGLVQQPQTAAAPLLSQQLLDQLASLARQQPNLFQQTQTMMPSDTAASFNTTNRPPFPATVSQPGVPAPSSNAPAINLQALQTLLASAGVRPAMLGQQPQLPMANAPVANPYFQPQQTPLGPQTGSVYPQQQPQGIPFHQMPPQQTLPSYQQHLPPGAAPQFRPQFGANISAHLAQQMERGRAILQQQYPPAPHQQHQQQPQSQSQSQSQPQPQPQPQQNHNHPPQHPDRIHRGGGGHHGGHRNHQHQHQHQSHHHQHHDSRGGSWRRDDRRHR